MTIRPDNHYDIDRTSVLNACVNALDTWRPVMGQFFLARFLGLKIRYTEKNECVIEFEVLPFMLNPKGTLHGGVAALVLDTSMGHLLAYFYSPASTVEMKVQYLRPLQSGPAKVVASIIKQGRKLCFVQASLYDRNDKVAAFATSTWAPIPKA